MTSGPPLTTEILAYHRVMTISMCCLLFKMVLQWIFLHSIRLFSGITNYPEDVKLMRRFHPNSRYFTEVDARRGWYMYSQRLRGLLLRDVVTIFMFWVAARLYRESSPCNAHWEANGGTILLIIFTCLFLVWNFMYMLGVPTLFRMWFWIGAIVCVLMLIIWANANIATCEMGNQNRLGLRGFITAIVMMGGLALLAALCFCICRPPELRKHIGDITGADDMMYGRHRAVGESTDYDRYPDYTTDKEGMIVEEEEHADYYTTYTDRPYSVYSSDYDL